MAPADTGRPAYHPAVLLKIYVYGYLNRLQSSRRLERETQRNVELMWLTGRLTPDFKTIADFRKDNGKAIRNVCREFIVLCRRLDLFSRSDRGHRRQQVQGGQQPRQELHRRTSSRSAMEQLEESIAAIWPSSTARIGSRPCVTEGRVSRLKEKIATVKAHMEQLKQIGQQLREAPDGQVSLTDPDARSMATSGRGTGIVGYNVQTAVDTKHHLIVAHEVTNVGHDRTQLFAMAKQARSATGTEDLTVVADRGYFKGEEILECDQAGMTPLVPKPLTSNSKAEGRFDKRDFVYIAEDDEYRCPAGQRAIKRFTTIEHGMTLHKYWSSACPRCPLKAQCTTSDYRRIARWEHEAVLEAMQERLDRQPDAMKLRRQTVEHPFGTLKAWMGVDPFPDQAAASRQHRDESPCAGLQPQTRDADHGHRTADAGDEGISPLSFLRDKPRRTSCQAHLPSNFRNNPRSTQSRAAVAHERGSGSPKRFRAR